MSEYECLYALLESTPFLLADSVTREVKLIPRVDALRLIMRGDGNPFPTTYIVDLQRALRGFAARPDVGGMDRTFSLREIAAIQGIHYQHAYRDSAQMGILKPSIRDFNGGGTGCVAGIFSWSDAFAAGAIGCLRRAGFRADVLRKIQPLIRGTAQPLRQRERMKA